MPKEKVPCLSEYEECKLLAQYLTIRKLKFSHISNEGGMKMPIQVVMKKKRMGLSRGVPDYIILLPGKYFANGLTRLLFIEMKIKTGGILSSEQDEWLKALIKVPNVITAVCCGYEEAKAVIDDYVS